MKDIRMYHKHNQTRNKEEAEEIEELKEAEEIEKVKETQEVKEIEELKETEINNKKEISLLEISFCFYFLFLSGLVF